MRSRCTMLDRSSSLRGSMLRQPNTWRRTGGPCIEACECEAVNGFFSPLTIQACIVLGSDVRVQKRKRRFGTTTPCRSGLSRSRASNPRFAWNRCGCLAVTWARRPS